jgi:hypothetical protein
MIRASAGVSRRVIYFPCDKKNGKQVSFFRLKEDNEVSKENIDIRFRERGKEGNGER